MFRATIALVTLYVAIAVAILATIVFLPSGVGGFFAGDAVGFTVVLVTGMVLVALYLAYNIVTYDASLLFVPVPPTACPDYYEQRIDRTGNTDVDHQVSCVSTMYSAPIMLDNTTFTEDRPARLLQALKTSPDNPKLVTCATMYPTMLARNETSDYELRKKFSAACQVPWTDNAGNFAILASQDGLL